MLARMAWKRSVDRQLIWVSYAQIVSFGDKLTHAFAAENDWRRITKCKDWPAHKAKI
jgi:hypothetical protein